MAHALDRHVALIGFMGAGKSTLGEVAAQSSAALRRRRPGARAVDAAVDPGALRAARRGGVPAARGRRRRVEALATSAPAVLALGGGAVGRRPIRKALRERALTVLVEVDAEEAWQRVAGSDRPLAQDEAAFRALFERAAAALRGGGGRRARDVDDVVLAAAGIHVEPGSLERLRRARAGRARSSSSATRGSPGIHGGRQLALGAPVATHELRDGRGGEDARCGRAALARAPARARRDARRARRRLHDRRGRLRRRDVPPRHSLGRGADDARRPGRRRDRRQDRDRPPGGQEPRRRLPLAGADGDRPRAARDAARERAPRAGWPRS